MVFCRKGPLLRSACIVGMLVAALAILAASAQAKHHRMRHTFAPKHGRIYHGVSDTADLGDFRNFQGQVKAHPAALQEFYHWDVTLKASGAFKRWNRSNTLGVVSMSTKFPATGAAEITPKQIAKGHGDRYLVRLNQTIAERGKPVLFRLFPEMNGYWNPYCGFQQSGSRRSASHDPKFLRQAFRRFVTIVRGGARKTVNHKLHALHMPRVLRAKSNHDRVYRRMNVKKHMPTPRVSFMWVPQTTGSPNVPGNQPANYWPGKRYVDWVGVDIYSAYASAAFPKMRQFYSRYKGYPFVVGEYSPWDNDFSGGFTRDLFHWAENHDRVKMLLYYRSVTADNPYYISHFPNARAVMRHELNKHVFAPFAPSAR
jgi:hypothetical protein